MASEHEGGEVSSAGQNGARPGSEPIPDGTDDMRARMKLRLAQNKAHAARENAARQVPVSSTVSAATPVSAGVRERSTGNGVSQMVWNSVLDSISAPSAAPAPAAAAPVTVEPTVVPTVVAAPVPAPAIAVPEVPAPAPEAAIATAEPAVDVAEQEAIAELFKQAAPAPDFGPIVPAMPVLAPPSRSAPPPRASAPIVEDQLGEVPAVTSKKQAKRAGKNAAAPAPKVMPASMVALQQRKKRHPIRSFLTFVLVLGLLGGAGFAGWYKFLRQRAVWSTELRPTVTFVEQTVHRSFDKSIPVSVLSAPEYEVKLGLAVLDRLAGTAAASPAAGSTADAAAGPDTSLLAVRAVGLVGADVQPTEVGHLVAASSPSFYSAADHTIYRVAGDNAVTQVSLLRSMTAALLDQDLDVASVMHSLTDSQQAGFQAMLDGVVAQVVSAKFRADPTIKDSYTFDLQTRRTDAGIIDGLLPVYLSKVVTSTDVGAFGYAGASPDDPLRNLAPPPSDAPVFDPTRDATAAPTTVAGTDDSKDARVLGVEFWFDALVPSLGAADARAAALLWTGDRSVTSLVSTQACLSSTIATATADDAAALSGFLGRWVQSVPVSANATVTPGADPAQPTVALSICEPAEGVVPPAAPLDDLASLFTQPDTERALLSRVSALGPQSTQSTQSTQATAVTNACVVAAYRNGSLPGFTAEATDAAMVTALTNVVTFCRSVG